jgi:hypothetical protein
MVIDLPQVHVAVANPTDIDWTLAYAGTDYHYPPQEVTIVPFEVAHKHWGFEFDEKGRLYRNKEKDYPDGEETQYYSTKASLLPWGWRNDPNPFEEGGQVSKSEQFKRLEKSFDAINGKLVQAPKKISRAVFESLPA